MTVLRTLRKLILGETWLLPLGVSAVIGLCAVARPLLGDLWNETGGFMLLAGTMIVLGASVARGARLRR